MVARRGAAICTGGYGGVMEAASRGAAETGGHVIGVTCDAFGPQRTPNPFISETVTTDSLFERLEQLIQRGDAYVVMEGAGGTLVEMALVWELRAKGLLNRERPFVVLATGWCMILDAAPLRAAIDSGPTRATTIGNLERLLFGASDQ